MFLACIGRRGGASSQSALGSAVWNAQVRSKGFADLIFVADVICLEKISHCAKDKEGLPVCIPLWRCFTDRAALAMHSLGCLTPKNRSWKGVVACVKVSQP